MVRSLFVGCKSLPHKNRSASAFPSLFTRKGLLLLVGDTSEQKSVRFEKCIGCPDIGMECLGPNLALLPITELRLWCKKWKEHYKLSIELCGEIWGIGGSAKRFLSAQETDFKYTTVQCIVRGIVSYGLAPETVLGSNPCPSTSAEMNAKYAEYEKQLKERQEECEYLLSRKNAHANEYIERMTELRENHEKQLANKEDTIRFLRDLADTQQKELEKAEAISKDYLNRIDVKNQQLLEAYAEIRQLNADMLKMVSANADDMKSMIDRFLRLTDAHTAEIKAITKT